MQNLKEFVYKKEKDEKEYELFVLSEDNTHIKGISLSSMPEEVKEQCTEFQENYEKELKKYFKYFKNFKKDQIVEYVENNE